MRNGVFHIALAFANHDEYEKELGKYSIKDFDEEEFVPFKSTEIEEDIPSEKEEMVKIIDRLNLEKKQLEEKLLELEIDQEEYEVVIKNRLQKEFETNLQECRNSYENRIEHLEKDLEDAKSKIPNGFFAKLKALFIS